MRMLSWTMALAATCFLAVAAPSSAATVPLTGAGLDYNVDPGAGFGGASGSVTDGQDVFEFEVTAYFDPIDPLNAPVGNLLVRDANSFSYLDGLLESIEIEKDFVALVFGDVLGNGAAKFGSKVRVVFTDFDWNSEIGTTSVTVSPVAAIPLPASALLLLSGMGGVIVVARKRKAA